MGWKAVVPFQLNGALCNLHKTALSLQRDAASQRHCMGCVSEMLFCSSQNLLLEFFMILPLVVSCRVSWNLRVTSCTPGSFSQRKGQCYFVRSRYWETQHRFLMGVVGLRSAKLRWGKDAFLIHFALEKGLRKSFLVIYRVLGNVGGQGCWYLPDCWMHWIPVFHWCLTLSETLNPLLCRQINLL